MTSDLHYGYGLWILIRCQLQDQTQILATMVRSPFSRCFSVFGIWNEYISSSEQDTSQDLCRETEFPSTSFKEHLEGRDIS
jgi:hypothetical protein